MAVIVSSLIFLITLALILTDRLERTIAALVGASAMVLAGELLGFYQEARALDAIDLETLGLLLGMMVLVALLEPTGFFQYVAARAAHASRGRPLVLLVLLGTITTVLSMVLDNVTTVVLIAPVTILVAEILGVSPVPYLIAEALLSNTGGVATLIGDPPNVLIGSAAGLTFNDFLTHSLPIVVFAWLAALGVLVVSFRQRLALSPPAPEVLARLDPRRALTQPQVARKVIVVLGLTVVLFFFQGAFDLSASFIALSMASLGLVWIRPPVREVLHRVEWGVLVFFTGLFVLVGGLEAAGAMDLISQGVARMSSSQPVLFAVGVIWLVAITSALVDNVPITVALIPVILELGSRGIEIRPLWWALALGAGFGGNATILGSSANIVVAELSKKTREPITSRVWHRHGIPVMLATCLVASLAFAVAYPLFLR